MAVIPNSIALAPGVGYAGQLAENDIPIIARGARCEGTGVHAGAPVLRGTDKGRQVKAVDAAVTAQNFAGIAILETSRPFEQAPPGDGDPITVLRFGSILMNFSAAVVAGKRVRVHTSDGVLDAVDAGTDPTAGYSILPGCVIAETTTAAGVAIVEVNIFGVAAESYAALLDT